MSGARPLVAVCTVTHEDAAQIERWAAALAALDVSALCDSALCDFSTRDSATRDSMHGDGGLAVEVVVVDCASGDATLERLSRVRLPWPLRVVELRENVGFAGGMNAAIDACSPGVRFVLSLNPDARPEPYALGALVACHRRWSAAGLRVGSVTGRLLREEVAGERRRLDACGMRLSPAWRHFDRGSSEIDRGQYPRAEEVFGGTGAATLYDVEALRDVAIDGEIFDRDFHTYREDAELAFRLRERGWRSIYEPAARIEHRRLNLPARRRQMSADANLHSLKNRYLLRLYHQTPLNLLTTLVTAQLREALIFAAVLVRERRSIPAWRWLWRNRRRLRARAAVVRARRTVSAFEIERWFWRDARPLLDEPGR